MGKFYSIEFKIVWDRGIQYEMYFLISAKVFVFRRESKIIE